MCSIVDSPQFNTGDRTEDKIFSEVYHKIINKDLLISQKSELELELGLRIKPHVNFEPTLSLCRLYGAAMADTMIREMVKLDIIRSFADKLIFKLY